MGEPLDPARSASVRDAADAAVTSPPEGAVLALDGVVARDLELGRRSDSAPPASSDTHLFL